MHAAIVTGVSRGLGEALAAALLARGFEVIGVGRTGSARHRSERFRFVACDLARPCADRRRGRCRRSRDLAARQPAAVTLINNAAVAWPVGLRRPPRRGESRPRSRRTSSRRWCSCNLSCRRFRDDAIARRIINISSGAAQSALAGSAAYCMSKAALEMLTRASSPSMRRRASLHLAAAGHLRDRHAGVHAQPRSGGVSERRAVPRLQGERRCSRSRPTSPRQIVDRLVRAESRTGAPTRTPTCSGRG